MKVYVFSIQFVNENGTIDYSKVEGVYADKEVAKQTAIKKCKEQQSFWEGSTAYKELGHNTEDFCNVMLERPDGVRKRYRIEAKELQQ